jgi:hypothetical protein
MKNMSDVMESVGKSFNVNGKFEEVNRLFDGRESVKMGEGKRLSLDIVSGLTDILKKINQKSPNNNLVDRVCEFIDEISEKEDAIWGLSAQGRNGMMLNVVFV